MAAVTTEAEVCNLALGLVGQRQTLDRLDEDTAEAMACATYFKTVRNDLLEAWPWRFASKRSVLALTTEERSGWAFCYQSPADLLKARRIWNGDTAPGAPRIPFTRELNDAATGHLILTNQPEAELVYTVELRTVALWSTAFVQAVAAQLALCLAPALAAKPQLMPTFERRAVLAFQRAAALDANETEPDEQAESEMISERY